MTRGNASIQNFTPIGRDGEVAGLDNDPMTAISRVFVYFLQNLYRDFPEGYGMKWKPDQEVSELVITAEKPKLEAIEKRPHITCVLGAGRFAGLGLDQMQGIRASDGQRIHTDLVPMSVAYHCQAKSGMHARRLAWNSSYYTIILRRVIMRVGGLFQVAVQHSISPEGPLTQYEGPSVETDLIESVVVVPFYWQPQWRIKKSAEVWRRMEISMSVNGVEAFHSAGRVRQPTVNGRPVTSVPLPRPPSTAFIQKVEDSKYFDEEKE
jgi:hypothetical protein